MFRSCTILLLALALLGASLTRAHFHVDFQDPAPRATLHLADAHHLTDHVGPSHEVEHGHAHHWLDLDAMSDVPGKPGKLPLPLLALLLAACLFAVAKSPLTWRTPPTLRFARSLKLHLRPPLRGPPLHAA